MSEIVLDKVCKRFPDGSDAVRDASFTIHEGEFFILVGPSGSGKSTLLNMIVGLESASEGEIRMNGRIINDLDPRDRNMAMVFQSYAIYPHMTVRENMAFPLHLAGLSRNEIDRRVEDTAAVLGLTDLLERKPRTLSGGQRQRVAMGRAIVREPAAFLLDEPLSNLDARLRVQMRTEIARIQKHLGVTTIYVTHDQTEAMTLGDRVAVLQGGVVQQVGTPRELYEHPDNLFVAGFIGSPAMNFLPVEFDGSRIILPMAQFDPQETLRSSLGDQPRPLIAGIRPEHFYHAGENTAEVMAGPTFLTRIDMAEWLGSDLYVYFQLPVGTGAISQPTVPDLDWLPHRDGMMTMTARLPGTSRAAEGKELSLRLNPGEIHLFDPATGKNIGVGPR